MKILMQKLCVFFAAILLTISFSLAGEFEPTLGDDGIYHYDWYHQSFLELEDDLEEALSAGKVLMVKFDQKGCIYCEKVALKILSEPAINRYVKEHFLVVQMDIFGSRDAIDLDGKELPENQMAARWGVVFTPSIYFITENNGAKTIPDAAAAVMPGAFMKTTFFGMLQWIKTGAYKNEPRFQKYYNDHFERLRNEVKAARSG